LEPIQKEAVWPGVLEQDTMWAFADQGSYKMKLRKAYKKHDKMLAQAKDLQEIIDTKFKDDVLFENFIEMIYEKEEELDDEIIL